MAASLSRRLRRFIRARSQGRHGVSPTPYTLKGRRIYILPTGMGVAFALMVFAMFMGAMNYANNLALALCFLLGTLGLVAMHYCHRNLAGVQITLGDAEAVFAGEIARFHIGVDNTASVSRHDITLANEHSESGPSSLCPRGRAEFVLQIPSLQRGLLALDPVRISTRYPFGLFRAWAYVHLPGSCIIYPKPAPPGQVPPLHDTDIGGARDVRSGDEDFVGLRDYLPGDPLHRIAWKAYARDDTLLVKQYAGSAVRSHSFDWDALESMDVEMRLSQLARWIEDAHAGGRAYSLRLPSEHVALNIGLAHRHRCLSALALFRVSAIDA